MAFDLKIQDTENGIDLVNLGNDLATTNSVSTMIYLCLFGGNVKESTVINLVNKESFDWWGNSFLEPNQQFNSLTERILNTTQLSSEGRTVIENAIKSDLKYLNNFFKIDVKVKLPYVDHVRIELTLTKIETSQEGVLIINLRKTATGDFSIFDFSGADFLI